MQQHEESLRDHSNMMRAQQLKHAEAVKSHTDAASTEQQQLRAGLQVCAWLRLRVLRSGRSL